MSRRGYSAGAEAKESLKKIEERVFKVCKGYDKLGGVQVLLFFLFKMKTFVAGVPQSETGRAPVQPRAPAHHRAHLEPGAPSSQVIRQNCR